MSKQINNCEHCGKEFEGIRSNQRFCSAKCSHRNWCENNKERVRAMHKKSLEKNKQIKKCEYCGEEFESIRSSHVFCSKECSIKKAFENNKQIKNCEHCGKEFESIRSSHVFCSKECRMQKWLENNKEKFKVAKKEWRKKNPEKVRALKKRVRDKNPEHYRAKSKEWRAKNPELANIVSRKSKYRRAGYPEEWVEVKELQYQIKQEILKQRQGGETNG